MAVEVIHQSIPTNGTSLHALTAGQGFGVILLHGFPQSSYEWRHLLPTLATRFRVVAPDLRGMGDSQPDDTGQDRRTLARDIKGLLDELGIDRAVIIGHDYGGAVAQRFALDFPEAIERLVCIDIPYYPVLPSFSERQWTPAQLVHSWYMFLHLDPVLPEQIAEAAGASYLRWFYEHGSGSNGCPFTDADIAEYARWFTQPIRATAAFNLYRYYVTVDDEHWRADRGRVLDVPTLWVHGMQDPFVHAANLDLLGPAFTNLRIERFEESGHWVPEEAPEHLASVLRDFLQDLE
jgi:pimeloyl-ACP methyl ester carboxylesterase